MCCMVDAVLTRRVRGALGQGKVVLLRAPEGVEVCRGTRHVSLSTRR